ncbi:FHA domain-containing protein [Halomonas sp. SpR8]|uniref:SctD/MshK family protein n=1 Tax=Halomonas sp. SpR8 TaxID=3050463 RepID=UPI0027E4DA2F|nr:EscD/YscD/HrpQ family type III secretion system periplasmic domain-containing protein [Halomonas sp. SpR8]MDQ7729742.1 EscD/YscD/HrpQ family type III secretion system periplasmic domain-containing protein [Halomonas sp. SpR8]
MASSFTTSIGSFKTSIGSFKTSIGSLFTPSAGVYSTLQVTEGVHQGVAVSLEQAVCRIGAEEPADVMLCDEGVAAEHVILRFHARMVAVEAVGGEVVIGGETLTQGTGRRIDLPTTLDIGGAQLRLSRPETSLAPVMRLAYEAVEPALRAARNSLPHKLLSRRRYSSGGERVGRGAVLTALCTVLGIAGAYQLVGVDEAGANISAEALNSTATLYPQVVETALITEQHETPAEALENQLQQADLGGLQVRDAGNHLVVSGEFAPERHEDWQGVQRWFDQRYGSSQVLVSNAKLSLASDQPAFRFQAVWLGDNPYVIGAKGERLYPGASLPEGWVLAAIGDEQVTLRRGDEQFFLTL